MALSHFSELIAERHINLFGLQFHRTPHVEEKGENKLKDQSLPQLSLWDQVQIQ